MRSLSAILISLWSFGLSSCLSMSSLQSARTLKKGDTSFVFAAGTRIPKINAYDEENTKIAKEVGSKPRTAFEVAGRFGIGYGLDVGLKGTLLGALGGDVKFLLVGKGRPYALSIGLAAMKDFMGVSYIANLKTDARSFQEVSFSTIAAPIYFTYDLTKLISVHSSVRYAETWSEFEPYLPSSVSNNVILSFGIGYAFLIGEYAQAFPMGSKDHALKQISIGFTTDWAGFSSGNKKDAS